MLYGFCGLEFLVSAAGLLALSGHPPRPKAGASSTHSPNASRHSVAALLRWEISGPARNRSETSVPFCGGGRRIGAVGLLFPVLEAASDSFLQVGVHFIGDR